MSQALTLFGVNPEMEHHWQDSQGRVENKQRTKLSNNHTEGHNFGWLMLHTR